SIAHLPDGTRYLILAPLIQQQKGEYRDLFDDLLKQGFLRARVDGTIVQLTDDLRLDRHMKHTIEVVIDRLTAGKTGRARLAEAVETALRLSNGTLLLSRESRVESPEPEQKSDGFAGAGHSSSGSRLSSLDSRLYSAHYACTHCGIGYEPPSPQLFSFNSPLGMCHDCTGLGMRHDFVIDRLVADDGLSIAQGAIALIKPWQNMGRWKRHIYKGVAAAIEEDLELRKDSFLKTPWSKLPDAAKTLFLRGMGERHITFTWRSGGNVWKHGGTWEGVVPRLLENYRKTRNPMRRRQLEKYMDFNVCSSCAGSRLSAQARGVTITSRSGGLPACRSGEADTQSRANRAEFDSPPDESRRRTARDYGSLNLP
ncbi:MAG: excinuclease ABC subunit UvrA, partial [Planctomycetaceae bacterium]